MKKVLSLVGVICAFSFGAKAQTVVLEHDTVTEYTQGLPPGANFDDAITLANYVKNTGSAATADLKWQIVEVFDSSAAPYLGWFIYSFCDNMSCFFSDALAVNGSNPLQFHEFGFASIQPGGQSDFKMQVFVPESTPNGTVGIVKVRLWDATFVDTATFVIIKGAVSTKTILLTDNRVSVFPNPSRGSLSVYINKELGATSISVVNLLGATVANANVTSETVTVNGTEQLASGTYLINVLSQDGSVLTSRKWVKQ